MSSQGPQSDSLVPVTDTVGQGKLAKWQLQHTLHRAAAETTSTLAAFVDISRKANRERLLRPEEIALLSSTDLDQMLALARNPLGADLPNCFIKVDSTELAVGYLQFYVRQVSYKPVDLLADMLKMVEPYPALRPRVSVIVEEIKHHINHGTNRVWLRYAGQTCESTPEDRDKADSKQRGSFITNFLHHTGKQMDIFVLEDVKVSMDARTYRAKEDWQAVERAMVSCLWPLSLNSARGGFKHIPEDALFSPPLPLPAPDVDRPSMMLGIEQRIAHHVDDMVAEWTKRTGQTMDPQSIETVKTAMAPQNTYGGVVIAVRFSKDVTQEEFLGHKGIDYHGPLAGPGPSLSVAMQVRSHGSQLPLSRPEILKILGPMVNLWSVSVIHNEVLVAILFLWRAYQVWQTKQREGSGGAYTAPDYVL